PVMSLLRCVPYPTTTTSPRDTNSGISSTSIVPCPLTTSSCDPYPTELNTRTDSEEGTRMLYLPCTSVIVPMAVPLTATLTPGNPSGSSAEVTVPTTSNSS